MIFDCGTQTRKGYNKQWFLTFSAWDTFWDLYESRGTLGPDFLITIPKK